MKSDAKFDRVPGRSRDPKIAEFHDKQYTADQNSSQLHRNMEHASRTCSQDGRSVPFDWENLMKNVVGKVIDRYIEYKQGVMAKKKKIEEQKIREEARAHEERKRLCPSSDYNSSDSDQNPACTGAPVPSEQKEQAAYETDITAKKNSFKQYQRESTIYNILFSHSPKLRLKIGVDQQSDVLLLWTICLWVIVEEPYSVQLIL